MDIEHLTSKILPYAVLSAAIAAVVLGIRNAIPALKTNKIVSSLLPLVIGAIGGYLLVDLAPKEAASMRMLYGLLAGSFSAPIYHSVRRMMASRLKADSTKPNAGMETSYTDLSAVQIKAIREVKPATTDKTSADATAEKSSNGDT